MFVEKKNVSFVFIKKKVFEIKIKKQKKNNTKLPFIICGGKISDFDCSFLSGGTKER